MRKYATFSGRASRLEFWYFVLAITLLEAALAGVMLQGLTLLPSSSGAIGAVNSVASSVFRLVFLLPSLAVAFRRLHDSGKPGWMLFAVPAAAAALGAALLAAAALLAGVGLLPVAALSLLGVQGVLLGSFGYMVYLLARRGDPGPNRFG